MNAASIIGTNLLSDWSVMRRHGDEGANLISDSPVMSVNFNVCLSILAL